MLSHMGHIVGETMVYVANIDQLGDHVQCFVDVSNGDGIGMRLMHPRDLVVWIIDL